MLAFLLERDGITIEMLAGANFGDRLASADAEMLDPAYRAERLADADRLLTFLGAP